MKLTRQRQEGSCLGLTQRRYEVKRVWTGVLQVRRRVVDDEGGRRLWRLTEGGQALRTVATGKEDSGKVAVVDVEGWSKAKAAALNVWGSTVVGDGGEAATWAMIGGGARWLEAEDDEPG
ncbi:uncharacterized protein A4U43_C08F21800 [Asparagus officinalis]|nr:uncharacterized protein A4U43_C08F21800 [Asparagus officinalis]